MSVAQAEIIWALIAGYFALGLGLALAMLAGWLRRLDPLAATAPWRVKLLLVPGLVALWPLMLRRLARAGA